MKFRVCCILLITATLLRATAEEDRSITAQGDSTIPVPADGLDLKVTIESIKDTVAQAKQVVAKRLSELNSINEGFGIDVNTSVGTAEAKSLSVRKNWDWSRDEGRQHKGFVVSQEIQLKVFDLDVAASLVETLTDQEGMEVDDVHLVVKEKQRHEVKALQAAVKDAVVKAQGVANVLGMAIGFPKKVDLAPTAGSGDNGRLLRSVRGGDESSSSIGDAWRKGTIPFTAQVRLQFDLIEIY